MALQHHKYKKFYMHNQEALLSNNNKKKKNLLSMHLCEDEFLHFNGCLPMLPFVIYLTFGSLY